jgi:hypothetical protein
MKMETLLKLYIEKSKTCVRGLDDEGGEDDDEDDADDEDEEDTMRTTQLMNN